MRQPEDAPYGFIRPDGSEPSRYRAARKQDHSWRNAFIIAGIVSLIVIVVGVAGAIQAVTRPRTVTIVVTPTSIPGPSWITGATLGGLPDGFTAKYGQPMSDGNYQTRIGSHSVKISIESAAGADEYAHVSQVMLSFVGSGLSESDTDRLITPLLPSDAHGQGTTGDATHYLIEFTSAAIAEVFPDLGGDFHILCELVNAKTQQTTCTYALGFDENS